MEDNEEQQRTVPLIEEEIVTGTRTVKTGSVRVRKEVEHLQKAVEMPAVRDVITVNRVPLNQVIMTMPSIRQEGDITIVPVVEEELVVSKRLVLKEEIHIRRRSVESTAVKTVTLGREHAIIERLDETGQVISTGESKDGWAASTPLRNK